MRIEKQCAIVNSARVQQVCGIFDLSLSDVSTHEIECNFELPTKWNIGVIVGASGSGKTSLARELFADDVISAFEWDNQRSILDSFSHSCGIQDITSVLSSVGFSSPPSWLRPFHVLSNGEQFRVTIARALLEDRQRIVIDEFTSVVDRNVAKISSAAVAKTVRKLDKQLVAVSCHYDILEWLEPDWVYDVSSNDFTVGRSLRRPNIELRIEQVHHTAWQLFRKHHYLNTSLMINSKCFVAFWNNIPVAFTAWLYMPHPTRKKKFMREHRSVCLPDYQGVGIGNALSDKVAEYFTLQGFTAVSTTSHPAMIKARNKSIHWKMTRKPSMASNSKMSTLQGMGDSHAWNRTPASFVYVV